MKIVRPALNILADKDKKLQEVERELQDRIEVHSNLCHLLDLMHIVNGNRRELGKAADAWTSEQEWREKGYAVDLYHVKQVRNTLEAALIEYRKALADVYDFMGDKGLT